MIFFTKNIEPFISVNSGVKIVPEPCTLTDNREGFYLGSDNWNEELINKGANIEKISKQQIVNSNFGI